MKLQPGYLLSACGYMTVIVTVSSAAADGGGATSPLVTNLVGTTLFAGLASCLVLSLTGGEWGLALPWRLYVVVGLIGVGIAGLDEWGAFPGGVRSGSMAGFLLDTLGVVGLLTAHRLVHRTRTTAT
jgi:hypothetical protein